MITAFKPFSVFLLLLGVMTLHACYIEAPGPRHEIERDFPTVDFDRLEMGDALHIDVRQGPFFSVEARGDRRDIDDLIVEKEGSTLIVGYDRNRNHRRDVYITVSMPELYGVSFSGGSQSRISGFENDKPFSIGLSGASICQFDASVESMTLTLSGAAFLSLRGDARTLDADVSGASALHAFDFPIADATVVASGASEARVTATDNLRALATGASVIVYRGAPAVDSEVSGASIVRQESSDSI